MADTNEVRLERMTRREFRQRLQAGDLKLAIIPVGSIEQHLEHLAMCHDIASSTYVAEHTAHRLFPRAVVAVPLPIGISEHHMFAPGSLTAKPGSWLAVLFDAVESFVRHGVKNVLVLNGHGGNITPVDGIINQWKRYFDRDHPGCNIQYVTYWDLIPQAFAYDVLDTDFVPGHAQEFETAFALYAFPENVRMEVIADQEDSAPSHGTARKGKLLAEKAIEETAKFAQGMLDGSIKHAITGL